MATIHESDVTLLTVTTGNDTQDHDSWLQPPHHNRFTALFPGPSGWAGARRELLDFMVQGKINRGRHLTIWLGWLVGWGLTALLTQN